MKFNNPFGLIFIICSVLLIFFNWRFIDNTLGLFGLGIGGVAIYFLQQFFSKRLNKIFDGFKEKLKFVRRSPKKISTYENDQRNENLLNGLKDRVESICSSNMKIIEGGSLKFIETLNWKVNSKSKEFQFKGRLSDVVNEFQGSSIRSFSIIGEAGVGKTSAIYDYILERLSNSGFDLVPVYFSLSSWKKNQSLEEWLISELERSYHLDKKVSKNFIKDFKIFPFLDGFDQMTQEMRQTCVEEIYEYSKNNSIAITSRPRVFYEIIEHLKNTGIVTDHLFDIYELNPLTVEQVDEVFSTTGSYKTFKDVLQKSSKLKEFARYPMALFILTKIINDINSDEIEVINNSSDEELFHLLWKKYDFHVFNESYFLEQRNVITKSNNIRNWLKKIALTKDTFYIEELQPLFLSSKSMRIQYYFFSRIAQCVCIAISAGFFMSGPFDLFPSGVLAGLLAASVFLIKNRKKVPDIENQDFKLMLYSKDKNVFYYLSAISIHLIPFLIVLCLYYGFSTPRSPEISGEMNFNGTFSTTETNVGFLLAVLMALILGFRFSWQNLGFDIRLIEKVSHDWKKFLQYGFFGGCFLGVFLIFIAFILNSFFSNSGFGIWLKDQTYLSNVYFMAFLVGLVFGFCLFGIIGYLKEQDTLFEREEKKKFFEPNYGIHRSFINALKAGFFTTIILTIFHGGFIYFLENEITSSIKAFKSSIAFGILGFLWFGGLDVISHYCLRILLYLDNSGPLNYSKFLEQASNLRFVRIVGSGYEFMHPTIREYFYNANFKPMEHKKSKKFIIPIICICLILPIVFGLINRFNNTMFWQSELHGLVVNSRTALVRETNHLSTKLVVKGFDESETIDLVFSASGKIKVGTFTGFVDAGGTEGGFFGMGIKDIYDQPGMEPFQHGVLALRKKGEQNWRAFPDTDIYDIFSDEKKLFLKVEKNDSIEFKINDREFHNNSGSFFLTIDTIINNNKLQIISHRGSGGLEPENTLRSIKKAISLNVDKIEIDIHLSKDGDLVVMHDKKVDRTTNGKGLIKELESDYIKKLSIKNEFDPNLNNLKIPFLQEVFELIKETNITLLIEVKNPKLYPGIDVILIELIEKYNLENQVEIFSFDKKFVTNFKMAMPKLFVGLFNISPYNLDEIQNLDAVGIYYHSLLFKKSLLKEMHKKNIKVYVWSVNNQRAMQRMIELKVDGIITDRPDILRTTIGY